MTMSENSNAWWIGTVASLFRTEDERIVAQLASAAADRGLPPKPEQMESWRSTIQILRESFSSNGGFDQQWENLGLVFEFEIPRRARRIDVVLLSNESVLVVEMKVGATSFDRSSQIQAIDYALDLLDFHSESRNRRVTPVLIATNSTDDGAPADPLRGSMGVRNICPKSFRGVVEEFFATDEMPGEEGTSRWLGGSYQPTPGILEAAREVFAGHTVADISKANADNLTHTVATISEAINAARLESRHIICFVTGIPGSGKTLTGLSAAHAPQTEGEDPGFSYLSGNGPLVNVLRYAIALDRVRREPSTSKEKAKREATVLIQHVRDFFDTYIVDSEPPAENVIVFDEAQRAWDSQQMKNKSKSKVEKSQAQIALEVMERHEDFAVVVALVGNGQEINRGEAGIVEWFKALEKSPNWSVWTAPEMVPVVPEALSSRVSVRNHLHLDVVTRAPRGEKLAQWVDSLLSYNVKRAFELSKEIDRFPLLVTRDLDKARAFMKDCETDDIRIGAVATSQDRRLRAFGIERSTAFIRSIDWPMWFVHGRDDSRSSYSLEVAASEFECQGLELDWSLVCWGADLIPINDKWKGRRFKGDKWQTDKDSTMALNRYRVLLTRARKGMVIWVPDASTREILHVDNKLYDKVEDLLMSAGVQSLE